MPNSRKQLVAFALLACCITSKCLAQSKNIQAKTAVEPKEVEATKKSENSKTTAVPKIAVDPKKSLEIKKSVEAKKAVDIQKAALKDGIQNMSVVAEAPRLPAIIVHDSIVVVEDVIVKPYKINSHASYYHDKLNGRRTASGKPFDNKKFTAAHRTFPFGTQLKLTNTQNNKSVIVVVTDRGPFVKSREIDITKAAFMQIATNKNNGSVNITIEVVQ